jgi:cell wall assembly regulator SMI1
VPKDLVQSLRIHDGRPYIDHYELMSAKSIVRWLDDPPGAWSKGWLPFAQDSGGNCFGIDVASVGQVFRWERNLESVAATPYRSFGEWLAAVHRDLLAGACDVDDEGFVYRP